MKSALSAIALWCLLANPAFAGTLSTAEAEGLRTEVTTIMKSTERGDARGIIEYTHPSLKNLAGGREAFAEMVRESIEEIRKSGVKHLGTEVGRPTQTYLAGDEEVCFIPKVSIMELHGKKVKSTSFMIAIRRIGSRPWKYLDGSALRKNPDLLYQLLPRLERGISLPPNTVELL